MPIGVANHSSRPQIKGEKLHTCDNAIPREADSGINLQNTE
jgi:hypothetical protein